MTVPCVGAVTIHLSLQAEIFYWKQSDELRAREAAGSNDSSERAENRYTVCHSVRDKGKCCRNDNNSILLFSQTNSKIGREERKSDDKSTVHFLAGFSSSETESAVNHENP